jgi:hypothetical protein
MFDDDFFGQLDEIISWLEKKVTEKIIPNYCIEYTAYWNYEAKIKINDTEKFLNKLITVRLLYKKNDIKFWYINPEILSDEKWQKTITYKLWKFKIDEHKIILDLIIKKMIDVIDEY